MCVCVSCTNTMSLCLQYTVRLNTVWLEGDHCLTTSSFNFFIGIYGGSELGARVLWEALVDLRNEIREGRLEEIHIVDCDQTRVNAIIDSVQSPNFEEKIEYPTHTADLKPPVVLLASDSSSGHTHSAFLRNSYGSRFMHDMTQDPDDPGFRPRANSSDVCSRVDVSTSNPFAPAQPNPIFDPSLLVLPQPTALDSPLHNN